MPSDHQYADEVQFVLGVNEGSSLVALLLARARVPTHEICYGLNHEWCLAVVS